MNRLFALAALCIAVAGCASSPVSTTAAAPTPSQNIYLPEAFVADAQKGEIVLIRDGSFGGKCALGVYLDGKLVAAIEREQKLVMYASPGDHILGAGPNPNGGGVCNWFSDNLRREVGVSVIAGKQSKYRLAMVSGQISIMPTAFE
jgi:hypothetical protein